MTLDQLNNLEPAQARDEFLKCCGSNAWASEMTEARPFASVDDLLKKADDVWAALAEDDWLEAFRAHPKIGEKKAVAAQSRQAQNWSAQEQSAVATASGGTIKRLADGNREYEERFGFIFIVCASGKSSEEMLSMLKRRMPNDRHTEMRTAAEEQRKINRLRLEKLLNE